MHAHRFLLYDAGTSATFEAMAVCAFGERKRDSFSFFFFERETSDFFFVSSSPTSKCFFFFFILDQKRIRVTLTAAANRPKQKKARERMSVSFLKKNGRSK